MTKTTTITTGIFGASGYTGQELITLLKKHPAFRLEYAVSDSQVGEVVGYQDLTYIPQSEANQHSVDLVFLCTPHGVSAPLVQMALDNGAKVVDLSADLRLKTPAAFSQWYHEPHPVPELLPIPYGLPEINRHLLTHTNVIANPGCYPTATLLALAPLAREGAIQPHVSIIVDAKSGVSGAGIKPKPDTHFVEVFGNLKPYNIGRVHRHVGEMEQELRLLNPEVGELIFTPHLLPVDRGILATVYIPLKKGWSNGKVRAAFESAYFDEPLIDLLPDGKIAHLKDAVRTPKAVISLTQPSDGLVIVVSVIDNLLKGAASQAMQNANILFDLPETTGLETD